MTIGPLAFAQRMHCNGEPSRDWLLASWHWRWSITWSWSLIWSPHLRDYPKAFRIKTNGGFIAGIRIPIVGDFHLQKQETMPWRRAEG